MAEVDVDVDVLLRLREQLIAVLVCSLLVNLCAVALRVLVRTRITKTFGIDDVGLLVAMLMYIIDVGLGVGAVYNGKGTPDFLTSPQYNPVQANVLGYWFHLACYFISGLVKLSVALVLYRITSAPELRNHRRTRILHHVLLVSMAVCLIWMTCTTLISAMGCLYRSPGSLSNSVCASTDISREVFYVVYDFFYVIMAAALVWTLRIRTWEKVCIAGLFGLSIFAAAATFVKLTITIEQWQLTDRDDLQHMHEDGTTHEKALWLRCAIWAGVEHGLALLACSTLGYRPLVVSVVRRCSTYWAGWKYSSYFTNTQTANTDDTTTFPEKRTRRSFGSETLGDEVELHTRKHQTNDHYIYVAHAG